jgi:hypothetical protein
MTFKPLYLLLIAPCDRLRRRAAFVTLPVPTTVRKARKIAPSTLRDIISTRSISSVKQLDYKD